MARAKTVDEYIDSAQNWQELLRKLRGILLACDLEETIKWGGPCYTHGGRNVVSLGAYKDFATLWFHQGALMKDPEGVLVNAQEGKTKSMRHWRFANQREIRVRAIKAYVRDAIAVAASGQKIPAAEPADTALVLPPELEAALAKRVTLRKAFAALTPGRQREYAAHIGDAKRAQTRLDRVAKALPLIESGVGLHDKYRK
ncbi:MAG: DUF1801 domain-containing protein [Pseudomonadota bacterium]